MSKPFKKYFWEVCKVAQRDCLLYKQMEQPEECHLYIFKQDNPDVVVQMVSPREKIHGWVCSQIQVYQKLNDNPLVSHWKQMTIPFKGELIPTLLHNFNQGLVLEIQQMVPRKTPALQKWLKDKIDEVIIVRSRTRTAFDNQHAFLQISMLVRTRFLNYYQMRAWRSKQWEGLLEIARAEGIDKNRSLGALFQEIFKDVMRFEVIRETKYENMFDFYLAKKSSKKERSVNQADKQKERAILEKYHLYEYIDDV